jgi:diamine N-acetyltransferase
MMNTEIVLEKILPKDAPILSGTAKKTFYDTFVGTCTPADMEHFLNYYYAVKVILAELENENYHYYFAKQNDEIVGYLLFEENNEEFKEYKKAIELRRFYVLNDYLGKGVAPIMMNHFLNYAAKNEYEIAFLGVWEYNYRAKNFYKKYGFVLTERIHIFPVGDTVQIDKYMIKNIK